ncbi:hypothetical protein CFC21_088852, partial [Triticum aestivum]
TPSRRALARRHVVKSPSQSLARPQVREPTTTSFASRAAAHQAGSSSSA